jgi:replicative DNA helicase Mcm
MARPDDTELIDRFEEFYRSYYRNEIADLAQKYPSDQKSLYIDWQDLSRFDTDLADDFRNKPAQLRQYAEEALRLYDLPVDVSLGQAHVRATGLPETTDIREIRSDHRGMLITVQGIVRKATDVRPKVTTAAFECQRCGTLTRIPQNSGDFQEPHECQGCERQGPFQINYDQSEFIDAQKLRVQESPEGLRGGETPQSIDVNIEDDITGEVTPGDHVAVTGILKLEQQGSQQEKSAMFDVYMDGLAVEIEDEEFEEMDITDEDKKRIIELSNEPDIYEQIRGAIAPSIYGYEKEKLAMALQLFSGVTKFLPDGSRTRGDLHMLLIGDPGTGKCQRYDTDVLLADGRVRKLGDIVEDHLDDPVEIDDGYRQATDIGVLTTDGETVQEGRATRVWKREAPDQMYRIHTTSGRELEVTPSHPLFVQEGSRLSPVTASELSEGEEIAAVRSAGGPGTSGGSVGLQTGEGPVVQKARVQHRLVGSDIGWDRIESIEAVEPDYEWVYDLEVSGTHNYISEGVVSHNSAMLQYVDNIAPRSVYTSGKGATSAGLCVTGDTLVHTTGGFREIQTLVAPDIPDEVDSETSVEHEQSLYTYDREDGTLGVRNSSHVWRMPEKPCHRIETGHGKELEASVNTPVLTCSEGRIEWRRIADVSQGEHVAVPAYSRIEGDIERSRIDIREYLELTDEKVKLADESLDAVREGLRERFDTLREAAATLEFSEDFIYDSLSNRHVPLEKLDRVLESIGYAREDVTFERVMLRHGDSITLPGQFDADLMYLLGLVFGDGDIAVDRCDGNRGCVRLSSGNEAVLERAADIVAEKFDKHVEIEYQDERVPCIRIHSATIARLFANAGMESPKENLSLDPKLTVAEHADAFLRGLMDADGAVSSRENGGSSIVFATISESLARQVQLMFETYDVRSRTRERDRRGTHELESGHVIESKHVQQFLEIYGADIDQYAREIGFGVEEKSEQLQQIVGRTERRPRRLPVGSALTTVETNTGAHQVRLARGYNPSREQAAEMLDSLDLGPVESLVSEAVDADLHWEEVVASLDTGRKEVFDLTVPGTHNFVGNGIVTHNTAAAVRDDFGDGQQWTLEAGALVLADKGIAAVDELDKMRCVTGDTLVHTAEGIRPIRELALDADCDRNVEHHENGRTIRDIDETVWTMAGTGQLTARDVTAVHEYSAPSELCAVRLESGESLTATPDHPFFVLDEGERAERPASELEPGDWVYVPDSIPTPTPDGGVLGVSADDGTPTTTVTPEHGAVLGYIAGDGNIYCDSEQGYGIRFTNKEEALLADFERACREIFDTEPVRPPSEQRDDGVETVHVFGKAHVEELLAAGINLETYEGKRVPAAVAQGPREVKSAFIRALADSEGTVDYHKVTVSSASYELLLGTKMLLAEFGITAQIQTDERDGRRDVYTLAITAADSLARFRDQIGFVLDRKAGSLDAVCERVSGERTILDVLPECGALFSEARESLRLYQSECGLNDATYCNFENGDANFSLSKAERVLERFEERREQANTDAEMLDTPCPWTTLSEIKERHHVSQRELAEGTAYSQQQISARWGEDERLRNTVRNRLRTLLGNVGETNLSALRELTGGDVKWRRVAAVEETAPTVADGQIPILEHRLADLLGTDQDEAERRATELLSTEPTAESWSELRDELERHAIPLQRIADRMDVANSTVSRWCNGVVDGESFETVWAVASNLIEAKRSRVQTLLAELDNRREPKVYDLTVEGTHNFLANGMVVHNSEDQSAMHQALEEQAISVNKAGINATLKSRCSLLGAANPTMGRFDKFEPMSEQIDLAPPLISRFDLIFTVTDQPDPEEDAELAEHILQTNYAGELNTHRTEVNNSNYSADEVDRVTEEVAPTIEPDLLRKYIAFARRTCYPTMTEEAKDRIQEFYVDLRAEGTGEDAPVPVTARKLEALVRLAEASARVRLSDTVEREDADRGVDIAHYCLKEIGLDPETGELDADVIETGTSKTQRDRVKNLLDIVAEIEDEYDEGAPVDVVVERAEEVGVPPDKAEHEIEKLKQKGEIYQPQRDHLRTT